MSTLEKNGSFRAPLSREIQKNKADVPKFGKVRQLASVEYGMATDSRGESFPAKAVLPVPSSTEDAPADVPQVLGQKEKFRQLEPFVAAAKEFAKSQQQTLSAFGKFLKSQPNWTSEVKRLRMNQETIALQFAQFYSGVFAITRRNGTRYVKAKAGRLREQLRAQNR